VPSSHSWEFKEGGGVTLGLGFLFFEGWIGWVNGLLGTFV